MYAMYVRVVRVYITDISALSIFQLLTNLKFGFFLYEILSSENNCIFCVTNASEYRSDSSVFRCHKKIKKDFVFMWQSTSITIVFNLCRC